MSSKRRIGLTASILSPQSYVDYRNALSSDWDGYLGRHFPDIMWMILPNLGEAIIPYLKEWGVDGIILTGGNSIGKFAKRDATEIALLQHSVKTGLPVFGVCRGLQLMQHFWGGRVTDIGSTSHVATRHAVTTELEPDKPMQVNSYHEQGVLTGDLAPELASLATSDDAYVEACRARNHNMAAVQWHPEREGAPVEFDTEFIRKTLKLQR